MRKTALAAMASVAMLAACQTAAKPLSPADDAAIRAMVAQFNAAVNANNPDSMTAGFASDATIHPNGMPAVSGTAQIKELWTGLTTTMRATNFAHTVTRLEGLGDIAWLEGTYHLEATLNDSTHAVMPPEDGKFIQVMKRQADGSWKVVSDSWNTNTMPAAPAPAAPARHR